VNRPPILDLSRPDGPARPGDRRRDQRLDLPPRVRHLAERLGREPEALPAYLYDLDALAGHAARIRAALPPGVRLCYAVKANPDPEVLRALAPHVDALEVSSVGELRHAAAAVPGRGIAFGGPGKAPADLAAAVRAGTGRIHVESPNELWLIETAARTVGRVVDVLFRVNLPDPDPGPELAGSSAGTASLVMGGRPSPFGMDPDLLDECAARLAAGGGPGPVRLRGLHAHLASGLDPDALLGLAARVLDFGRDWCARHGVPEPEFNLGGGMAVDYRRPEAVFDWDAYGRGLARLARPGETLWIEPGRSVTAYCGWYLTRVLDVKRSHGEAFAVVAGGTHHLRTPAAKGHDQPFAVIPVADWPDGRPRPGLGGPGQTSPGQTSPGSAEEPVTLAGQLCTPKDVLARRVPAGRLRAGDLVVFGLAGAYAWNISHHDFLMHPPPGFHYLTGEAAR
jgi:diaminopimelate decarboxylase